MVVYLCGPINGCTDDECMNWREEAKRRLKNTIDPMERDYRGLESECVDEIVELDKQDIDNSDILLVNYVKPSVGTSMEILYAWERGKRIYVVAPKGVTISPWLAYHSHLIFNRFEDFYSFLG